jgi:hypothetical protein
MNVRSGAIVAATLCLIAMAPGLPYGYFTILRLVVCGVAIFSAFTLFEKKSERLAWMCVAAAVIFNPIFKVHLGRELWWFADGLTAILFGVVAVTLRK